MKHKTRKRNRKYYKQKKTYKKRIGGNFFTGLFRLPKNSSKNRELDKEIKKNIEYAENRQYRSIVDLVTQFKALYNKIRDSNLVEIDKQTYYKKLEDIMNRKIEVHRFNASITNFKKLMEADSNNIKELTSSKKDKNGYPVMTPEIHEKIYKLLGDAYEIKDVNSDKQLLEFSKLYLEIKNIEENQLKKTNSFSKQLIEIFKTKSGSRISNTEFNTLARNRYHKYLENIRNNHIESTLSNPK